VAGLAGGAALESYGRVGVVVVSTGFGLVALLFTLATYRERPKVSVPAT
jgi:hypothetical protein